MTSERWQSVRELFDRALEYEGDRRTDFLLQVCPGDPELRAEVARLLEASNLAGDFIEQPARIPENLAAGALAGLLEGAEVDPLVGRTLRDRYDVEKLIGQGAFGRVYLAHDRNVDHRAVVVKLLTKARTGRWFEKRYEAELRSLARIRHPGVVEILDSGETEDGTPYLVMQYIQGSSLRDALSAGAMALARVSRLTCQLGEALSVVHRTGVCHRDLKPENIQICDPGEPNERAVILDFGIARSDEPAPSVQTTQIAGSPAYMAPEQMLGQASIASDIFSLGMIVFEMLTGRRLPEVQSDGQPAKTASEILARLRPETPIPARLALARTFSLQPQDRPQDAIAFATEFTDALVPRVSRKSRLWAGAVALAGIVALAAGGWTISIANRPVSELNYSLVSLRAGSLEAVTAERIFHAGDSIRMRIHAPKGGYLYLLTESAGSTADRPQMDLLFPGGSETSAWLPALQTLEIPRNGHTFTFDSQQGTETIWIVWSAERLPEFDDLIRFGVAQYQGEISDPIVAQRVMRILRSFRPVNPGLDDKGQSALLRGEGKQLVSKVTLRHE